jgi:hypothetical protein
MAVEPAGPAPELFVAFAAMAAMVGAILAATAIRSRRFPSITMPFWAASRAMLVAVPVFLLLAAATEAIRRSEPPPLTPGMCISDPRSPEPVDPRCFPPRSDR